MTARLNSSHNLIRTDAKYGSFLFLILIFAFISGCATFQPKPFEEAVYLTHAVTRSEGDITVTADIFSREETKEFFGFDFVGKGIQPIWIKIENTGKDPYWFVPHRLDP